MALRRIALCIPLLMLALAPLYVSTADVVDEPIEYVEEDGRKIPVLKATNAEDYDDSDVFVLTGDNFKETIGKHKHILVEFYAPWCGHCKQLKPEYGAAAKRLKRTHPDVVLAKFDAVADGAQAITKEFTVEGFPTMKWFVDGVAHPKDCQVREEADLVKWVVKKTSPPVKAVLNEDDMALLKSTDTRFAVVGFFDDIESKEFKTFAELAMHDDRYDFHFVADATIASGEGVSKMPAVIFYRNFDEPKVTYDKEFSAVDLADAVRTNARPRLIEMSEETAPLIFDNDLDKLLLFRPGTGVAMAEFTRASGDKELRGRYIFAAVGDKGDPGLAEFMGVSADDTEPELFLFEHAAHKKYRLDNSISLASIKELVKAFANKTLKAHFKTAPVLAGWDSEAVKSISSSQWAEVVMDPTKHAIVEFYAPWCDHCKTLEPKFLKAAQHLDNKYSEDLVFVKIDGTQNEIEDINVGGFPTVLAFAKSNKTAPIDLSEKLQGADAKKIVQEVKEVFKLGDKKRVGEGEYEIAAKRFKQAVKALKGPLTPAANELNRAAAVLEKMMVKKDEL